ncbi:unnamed protein product [Linum trigynum]|uniref:Uncharacterized protein n=1 Tax=Linum trigynum TaxID=586398 RepID=A0AAV2G8Y8_9ROSI
MYNSSSVKFPLPALDKATLKPPLSRPYLPPLLASYIASSPEHHPSLTLCCLPSVHRFFCSSSVQQCTSGVDSNLVTPSLVANRRRERRTEGDHGCSFWRLGSLDFLHGNSGSTACIEGGKVLYNVEDLTVEGEAWKVVIKAIQVPNAKLRSCPIFTKEKHESEELRLHIWSLRRNQEVIQAGKNRVKCYKPRTGID